MTYPLIANRKRYYEKKTKIQEPIPESTQNSIPDIEIIDLEQEHNLGLFRRKKKENAPTPEPAPVEEPIAETQTTKVQPVEEPVWEEPEEAIHLGETDLEKPQPEKRASGMNWRSLMNTHVLLLAVFVIFIVCLVIKFKNWGVYVDPSQIDHDKQGTYLDVLDQILPLTDKDGKPVPTGKVDTILAFGNAPFADDRDSKDNLANMIADATGATVYNCSVSGSYLAAQYPYFSAQDSAMDAYTFYWLATLVSTGGNAHYYPEAVKALSLMDAVPPEAEEVYDILTTIDMNEVDVITIMYDASDYLMGHEMYDDANETNIQQFTGNLEAGIEMIQATYPHIRIIVMSPTYAYAVDEKGNYVSSGVYRYGQDVLSTYVIKEYSSCASRSVSFIDHLYGTITEANADEYLIDNLHLNVEGRKLVAERFLKVLNYYNK